MDKETAFNVVAACLEGVAVLFDIYTIDCVLFLANSYGAILRVLVDWPGPAATRNQPNKYWLLLSVLKQRIDQGFDVGNEGLRQVCVTGPRNLFLSGAKLTRINCNSAKT